MTADCSVYATANGLANLALNRDKVTQFVNGSRLVYKGWLHGYERAAAVRGSKLVSMASKGVKSTLGPSVVYGVSMRLATGAMGLPSLVAVGAANVATPIVVNRLGGSLSKLSTTSLAARALPIAAHCVIEWGLYDHLKQYLESHNVHVLSPESCVSGGDAGVPRTRMKMVVEGALVGGASAAVATAATVVTLSPWYGGKLLRKAMMAQSATAASRLSWAALRVTKIRLSDSLQQGVVWFSTYEGMRAAMAIYDEKQNVEERKAKKVLDGAPFTVSASEATTSLDENDAVRETTSDLRPSSPPPRSPRFSRKMTSPRMSRSSSSGDFSHAVSPRRKILCNG